MQMKSKNKLFEISVIRENRGKCTQTGKKAAAIMLHFSIMLFKD